MEKCGSENVVSSRLHGEIRKFKPEENGSFVQTALRSTVKFGFGSMFALSFLMLSHFLQNGVNIIEILGC